MMVVCLFRVREKARRILRDRIRGIGDEGILVALDSHVRSHEVPSGQRAEKPQKERTFGKNLAKGNRADDTFFHKRLDLKRNIVYNISE